MQKLVTRYQLHENLWQMQVLQKYNAQQCAGTCRRELECPAILEVVEARLKETFTREANNNELEGAPRQAAFEDWRNTRKIQNLAQRLLIFERTRRGI